MATTTRVSRGFLIKIETVHGLPRHSTAFKALIKRLQKRPLGHVLYSVCGRAQQGACPAVWQFGPTAQTTCAKTYQNLAGPLANF
jgi:hypothetical protein